MGRHFLPTAVDVTAVSFGFVVAIGYAGAAATVWACIIPALLAYKSRAMKGGQEGFIAPGGQPMIIMVILFGLLTAVFHFLSMLGHLPVFNG
ncbi:hypothetical protein PCI56_10655 [Plesiomonas shigelloides subsp. oncorhynchi]|nr:hypothetical protein [Plesiomonas shigelloides]